jgi:hypothetical protein
MDLFGNIISLIVEFFTPPYFHSNNNDSYLGYLAKVLIVFVVIGVISYIIAKIF